MKLIDAMRLVKMPTPKQGPPFRVLLCCGFTPLHLETLLIAHLRQRLSARAVIVDTGTYGDCIGSFERASAGEYDSVFLAIEWPDLDPRLGYRQAGGWGTSVHADVVQTAAAQIRRLEKALASRTAPGSVVISPPTLPLPPLSHTVRAQASGFDTALRRLVVDALDRMAVVAGISIVAADEIDAHSPLSSRLDLKSELLAGFPYRVPHASVVASAASALAVPAVPKKGLITDLDDTLWHGAVGEVGPDDISFGLDDGTQVHALYQQFLAALADAGVLIGAASRNDPEMVKAALSRGDLVLSGERLFPVEAHWGEKSESVGRILRAWNISSDAVVVVDDSPRELAEIEAAFPGIECRVFPGVTSPDGVLTLMGDLRDLFGRPNVKNEDRIRAESLRTRSPLAQAGGWTTAAEEILAGADAELDIDFDRAPGDGRALELVNKTNQFNLNGRRFTVGEWAAVTQSESAFVATFGYRDRFGPLGRIAVMAGRRADRELTVCAWVLSCRAFARRIEHRCLAVLFERFPIDIMHFEFAPTARNAPIRDFFAAILGHQPEGPFSISRSAYMSWCPALHQSIHVRS